MKLWLLEQSTLDAMSRASLNWNPSANDLAAIMAPSGQAKSVMEVVGNTATISVRGVLTSQRDFMAMIFGGGNTLYGDIASAIREVEGNAQVKNVDFYFHSGGGEALPVAEIADMIADMKKPTRAIVDVAASAAYWLASSAKEIVARTPAAYVGSVGVVRTMAKPDESPYLEVTSTPAPNKRPDPTTDEGLAVIRAEIDQIEELFIASVASGRDTSVESVHNNFGKGGMLLAKAALDAGMIDRIDSKTTKKIKTRPTATGALKMDVEQLKAEHPGLYAQVFDLGKKDGAAAELDRVKFHCTMGEKNGCSDVALKACLENKPKDDGETLAEYLSAGCNKRDLASRESDDADLGDTTTAATGADQKDAAVASIFAAAGEQLGLGE